MRAKSRAFLMTAVIVVGASCANIVHVERFRDGPLCPSENNGVCDEPDTCAEGTDRDDCASAGCHYVNDGVCDEPNICPPGTDTADCASAGCPYVNDGVCDEPNSCPPGTDTADCASAACSFVNDGVCDEPNSCPPGTDTADCNSGLCDGAVICDGCIDCAFTGNCSDELAACYDSTECVPFSDCIQPCANNACYQACVDQYMAGAEIYSTLAYCVICDECYVSCDGESSGCP